jgi:hypothetical protein
MSHDARSIAHTLYGIARAVESGELMRAIRAELAAEGVTAALPDLRDPGDVAERIRRVARGIDGAA